MKRRKYIVVVAAMIIILLMVCGICKKAGPSQMPGIVFVKTWQYEPNYDWETIGFYDRNGQFYTSDNQEVCSMRLRELVRAYEAGELEGKIKRSWRTCDADELFENYRKLCEVSKNEAVKIVYPDVDVGMPAVLDDIIEWYGIYYDKGGELQAICIHRRNIRDYDTNNEQANEIYAWYEGTFAR